MVGIHGNSILGGCDCRNLLTADIYEARSSAIFDSGDLAGSGTGVTTKTEFHIVARLFNEQFQCLVFLQNWVRTLKAVKRFARTNPDKTSRPEALSMVEDKLKTAQGVYLRRAEASTGSDPMMYARYFGDKVFTNVEVETGILSLMVYTDNPVQARRIANMAWSSSFERSCVAKKPVWSTSSIT